MLDIDAIIVTTIVCPTNAKYASCISRANGSWNSALHSVDENPSSVTPCSQPAGAARTIRQAKLAKIGAAIMARNVSILFELVGCSLYTRPLDLLAGLWTASFRTRSRYDRTDN